MKSISNFSLSKYQDVVARGEGIYERLANGSMPCDQAWPPEHVLLFRKWLDEGANP